MEKQTNGQKYANRIGWNCLYQSLEKSIVWVSIAFYILENKSEMYKKIQNTVLIEVQDLHIVMPHFSKTNICNPRPNPVKRLYPNI